MAAIVTTAVGGYSDEPSTWVGGVVPIEGDTATNVATSKLIPRGSHTWGADTSSYAVPALSNLGTIIFSDQVDTSLRFKGTFTMGPGAKWIRGTLANPIPAHVKSTIIWNYSATPSNGEFQSVIGQSAAYTWSEVGAPKTLQFFLPYGVAAGATSMIVSDATVMQVGDIVFIEASSMIVAQREHRILTGKNNNVVAWDMPLLYSHMAGCFGGNLSSNVSWQTNSDYYGLLQLYTGAVNTPALLNIKNVSFHNMYMTVHGNNYARGPTNPIGVLDNLSFSDVLPSGVVGRPANDQNFLTVTSTHAGKMTGSVSYTTQANVFHYQGSVGGSLEIENHFACGGFALINSRTGVGAVAFKLKDVRHTNSRGLAYSPAGLAGFQAENLTIDGCEGFWTLSNGNLYFKGLKAGLIYGNGRGYGTLLNATPNVASQLTLEDSYIADGPIFDPAVYKNVYDGIPLTIINRNGDTTAQERYISTGAMVRDNTKLTRSRSSIKFSPYIADRAHGYSFSVAASAGLSYTFVFALAYDATYGTATPPTVTVSGLGITPQTFAAGGSANTDYQGTITVTPTSTGVLTVTISGQTTDTLGAGSYWFSGMSVDPWINWTQHYGYTYAPTSPTQTVDSVVQLSESAAAALTGIAYASGAFASSGRTMREIYDWAKQYEASNRLAPLITSGDGKTFITASSMAISGSMGGGSVTAQAFTFTGAVSDIALTGNVAQATPTALTNVAITGDLTYATNTPITVTLTSATPTVTGTISNTGSALVTVRLVGGTTVGTVGSNVVTQIVTSLTLTGLTAGSSIYVADASGTQVDYVASSGTSYTLDTTGGTGTWTYKVARYGYTAQTGTHTPATTSTWVSVALVADPFVTQPTVATVVAYTQLGNPDRVYDYAAYFETTSAGIPLARIAAKAGSFCSVGAYPVTMATSGAVWAISGGTLTLNSGTAFAPGVTMTSGLLSTAAITAADTSAFTAVLSDSTGIRAPLTIAPAVSLLGAQVHMYDQDSAATGDLGTELAGTTSCAAASFTYFGPAGNTVWLQVLKDGYLEYGSSLITPSAASTTSPTLEQDYIQ